MMWKTDWKAERMVERMPWKISRMEEMRFVRPSNMPAMMVADDLVCLERLGVFGEVGCVGKVFVERGDEMRWRRKGIVLIEQSLVGADDRLFLR